VFAREGASWWFTFEGLDLQLRSDVTSLKTQIRVLHKNCLRYRRMGGTLHAIEL